MSNGQSERREMTGAEMVVQALIDNGVKHLFGYPGGAVLPIYDELFQQDAVQRRDTRVRRAKRASCW